MSFLQRCGLSSTSPLLPTLHEADMCLELYKALLQCLCSCHILPHLLPCRSAVANGVGEACPLEFCLTPCMSMWHFIVYWGKFTWGSCARTWFIGLKTWVCTKQWQLLLSATGLSREPFKIFFFFFEGQGISLLPCLVLHSSCRLLCWSSYWRAAEGADLLYEPSLWRTFGLSLRDEILWNSDCQPHRPLSRHILYRTPLLLVWPADMFYAATTIYPSTANKIATLRLRLHYEFCRKRQCK